MQAARKPVEMVLVALNFFVGKLYIAFVFSTLSQFLPEDLGIFGVGMDSRWVGVIIALAIGYAGVYLSQSNLQKRLVAALQAAVDKQADVHQPFSLAMNKFTSTFLLCAFLHGHAVAVKVWSETWGKSPLSMLVLTVLQAVLSLYLTHLLHEHEDTLFKAIPMKQRLEPDGASEMSAEVKTSMIDWHVHKQFTSIVCGNLSCLLSIILANNLGKVTLVPLFGVWLTLVLYLVFVGTVVERERRVIARARLKAATKKIMKSNRLKMAALLTKAAKETKVEAPAEKKAAPPAQSTTSGCEHYNGMVSTFNLRRDVQEGWHDYAYNSLFMIPVNGFVSAVGATFGIFANGGPSFLSAFVLLVCYLGAVALIEKALFLYLQHHHTVLKKKHGDDDGAGNSNREHDRSWRMCVSICEMLTLGLSFSLAGIFSTPTNNAINAATGPGWCQPIVFLVLALAATVGMVPAGKHFAEAFPRKSLKVIMSPVVVGFADVFV
jgi:hypothetical protein